MVQIKAGMGCGQWDGLVSLVTKDGGKDPSSLAMVFRLELKVDPNRFDSNRSDGLSQIATCPYRPRE